MTRNTAKIREGIRALSHKPFEILSGTVVAGSVDSRAYTMSVMPSDGGDAIQGVLLSSVSENANGMIVFPKDGSNVIIGSIDGSGEWTLLKASDLAKAIIAIENVVYQIDDTQVNIQNGSVVFNMGASMFKMNTASESLFQWLNDLTTAMTLLTVGTSSGPSTVPINVATFNTLLTRLNNLLIA